MYAVIQSGGKQHRVSPGDVLKLEKLQGGSGDSVTFDQVLLTSDGKNTKIGKPYLSKASVKARVVQQGRDRKVAVVKFKAKKRYLRRKGHRQHFTQLQVMEIKG